MDDQVEKIEKYISGFPPEKREILERVRKTIKDAAPEAKEAMGYGVPAFKLDGKYLVYYAALKNHIGFYPTPDAIAIFKDELVKYKQSKGTIQFQLDKPIPYDLIKKIVRYRANK